MIIKKIAALALSLCAMLGIAGCTQQSESSTEPIDPAEAAALTVFDVGKADAMVFQTKNSVTVIDTGNKGDGKVITQFLTDQGISKIDTLIITHFDKDHVGGATKIVNQMEIDNIYVPDYKSDSDEYLSFAVKAKDKGLTITQIPTAESIAWSDEIAAFTLYAPNQTDYGENEENDFSLCLLVDHGNNRFLFTGDAEETRQQEIMDIGISSDIDFLKFPYHGHYLSTTEAFLDTFSPKYTVICCSEKEYADDGTVETLQKRGIEAYYTTDGTVTVLSDGNNLSCSQE